MEAFSDGMLAIIITIMVLEMKVPHGTGLDALRPVMPVFLSYVLSFVYIGIYWNNHHHMLHTTEHVRGGELWANLHLLFWLSLIPFATGWLGENWMGEHEAAGAHTLAWPAAVYGVVLLGAAIAYFVLQGAIIRHQGEGSKLKRAVGRDVKGKVSPVIYAAAIGLAFVNAWISVALYVAVAAHVAGAGQADRAQLLLNSRAALLSSSPPAPEILRDVEVHRSRRGGR
ncbi:MAG: TMEM175 family protein [Phycisphaerales bacterium]